MMNDKSSNERKNSIDIGDTSSDFLDPAVESLKSPREILERYGAWFIVSCFRFVRFYAAKRFDDEGEYDPESVSTKELLSILGDADESEFQVLLDEKSVPPLEECHNMAEFILDDIRARTTLTIESGKSLPLETLRRAFALSELELLFLVCAILVHYDDNYLRAYCYATGAPPDGWITAGFIQKLLAFSAENPEDVHRLVADDSKLLHYNLIELAPVGGWRNTPKFYAHVEVSERITSFILGESSKFVPVACRWILQEDGDGRAPFDVTCDEAVFAGLEKPASRLAVLGLQAGDRTASVRRVAKALAIPVLAFDLNRFYEVLKTQGELAVRTNLTMIVREVILQNAILLVSYDTCSKEARDWLHEQAHEFEKVFREENMRVCLLAERQSGATRALFGEMPDYVFPKPTRDQQAPVWEGCLRYFHIHLEVARAVAQAMAKGYCLSYAEVRDAIEQTLARLPNVAPEQALTPNNLTETLNRSRGQQLEGLASLRSTWLTLDDIVLSPGIREKLNRILEVVA
ncbi:MAG: hypothetical protein FWC40_07605 [Proteobacteria bacterium]|nr:hypothetical protein [Pseudomonadota bacterium]